MKQDSGKWCKCMRRMYIKNIWRKKKKSFTFFGAVELWIRVCCVCVCIQCVYLYLYGILSNGKSYRPIIMTITSLLCLAYLYDFIWNHLKSTFLWTQIHINVVLLYHQNFFFFFPKNSICNIKSFLILKLILKCSAKGRSKIRVGMDRWLQIKVGFSFLSFPILLLMLPPASAFAVVKNAF